MSKSTAHLEAQFASEIQSFFIYKLTLSCYFQVTKEYYLIAVIYFDSNCRDDFLQMIQQIIFATNDLTNHNK